MVKAQILKLKRYRYYCAIYLLTGLLCCSSSRVFLWPNEPAVSFRLSSKGHSSNLSAAWGWSKPSSVAAANVTSPLVGLRDLCGCCFIYHSSQGRAAVRSSTTHACVLYSCCTSHHLEQGLSPLAATMALQRQSFAGRRAGGVKKLSISGLSTGMLQRNCHPFNHSISSTAVPRVHLHLNDILRRSSKPT
jgi:hypothetical protein